MNPGPIQSGISEPILKPGDKAPRFTLPTDEGKNVSLADLRVIPSDDDGRIRLDEYARLLNDRTRIVAAAQVSNALGTVTPIAEIIALAHGV